MLHFIFLDTQPACAIITICFNGNKKIIICILFCYIRKAVNMLTWMFDNFCKRQKTIEVGLNGFLFGAVFGCFRLFSAVSSSNKPSRGTIRVFKGRGRTSLGSI